MWEFKQEQVKGRSAQRYVFPELAIAKALEGLRSEPEFRTCLSRLMADCPFKAFTWEVKPFNGRVLENKFEFVLAKSRRLERVRASHRPFTRQFKEQPKSQSVIAFQNREKDATLVIPRPMDMDSNVYAHLGAFVRYGPEAQRQSFWKYLGETIAENLSVNPMWVSTSKVGRHWLHARIDSKPKHYRHTDYLKFSE